MVYKQSACRACPYRLSGAAAVAYVRTELSTRNVGISIMVDTSGTTAVSKRVTCRMYTSEARLAVRDDLLRVVEAPAMAEMRSSIGCQ